MIFGSIISRVLVHNTIIQITQYITILEYIPQYIIVSLGRLL